jgi:hypothetical protein
VDNLCTVAVKDSQLYLDGSGGSDMKKILVSVLFALLLVMVAGCAPGSSIQVNSPDSTIQLSAPGPNPLVNQPDANGRVARAVAGLWHGIIAPVTLVISFFNSDVQMYEVHNAGSEYDLGFLLGLVIVIAVLGLLVRTRR